VEHKKSKYLLLRGNIFYFRWRVPASLRSAFASVGFRRSLRTDDYSLATIRAGRFTLAVAAIQGVQRSFLMGEVALDDYIRISIKHWDAMSKTFKTGMVMVGDISVDFGGDSEKELKAVTALLQAKSDSDIALQRVINERPIPAERETVIKVSGSEMLFSELFEKFMAHKTDPVEAVTGKNKPINSKIQSNYRSYFNRLLPILGDKPINSITRKMLRKAILTCRCLPRGTLKAYKNIPVVDLLEMEIKESDRLSDGSVVEFKKLIQGMFRFAADSEDTSFGIDSSPAEKLNLKLGVAASYGVYSDSEVRLLLGEAWGECEAWKRWLPVLAAYTGCRRGELVQLRKQDVKLDTETQRYYLFISPKAGRLKTENATRSIPIHAELVALGFLDFVKSIDGVRLFGDLNPEKVTHWFVRLRDRLNIEYFDEHENRRVFHSFRHGFVTKSRGAGNPLENVQQVVGHEKTSAGVTDKYTHRQPLRVVLDVVDKVAYE
jgi:integrase